MTTNKISAMFNIEHIKKIIADCPKDEVVILCNHWSINKPKYSDDADPETEDWDFTEFKEELDTTLLVNDYDDLIADPHGIMNN
jgi:hypothetical protein